MASSMEVQPSSSKDVSDTVLASSGSSGSVSVALHPLVIMNISEHYTRIKAQYGKPNPQVIGALLGTQNGRNIEIFNSFELQFDLFDDGQIVINMEYYKTKEEQCCMVCRGLTSEIAYGHTLINSLSIHQVFKNLDFLGWYTTGSEPTENDIKVHKQMCEINESPLFLKLNPLAKTNDLPISLFESVIDIVDGAARMLFVQTHYTLATEEAERIGVDHVARLSNTGTVDTSTVSEHLLAQYNAIKMLHSRVKMILEYAKAVKNGEVPCNHEIMRDTLSLIQRLPVMQTDVFREDFYNQCNDVMLMCYLSTITKGANSLNEFINKFNVVYDRGMGRRMRGTLF